MSALAWRRISKVLCSSSRTPDSSSTRGRPDGPYSVQIHSPVLFSVRMWGPPEVRISAQRCFSSSAARVL